MDAESTLNVATKRCLACVVQSNFMNDSSGSVPEIGSSASARASSRGF